VKPSKNTPPDPQPFPEGELLRLELQIAKRADTLWMTAGRGGGSDLMHWLQAESEVLGQYLGSEAEAMAAER
jgi:hypothetical protein